MEQVSLAEVSKYKYYFYQTTTSFCNTTQMSHEDFRAKIGSEIQEFAKGSVDPQIWDALVEHFYYISGNFDAPEAVVLQKHEQQVVG